MLTALAVDAFALLKQAGNRSESGVPDSPTSSNQSLFGPRTNKGLIGAGHSQKRIT